MREHLTNKEQEMAQKVMRMLGREDEESTVSVNDGGVIVIEYGKPDLDSLVRRALTL